MPDSSSTSSPPTSETTLAFTRPDGTALDAPPEWSTGFIRIEAPGVPWGELRLTRNGLPLEVGRRHLGEEIGTVAEWPLAGTGYYELRLSAAGQELSRTMWTVRPRKITEQEYSNLLDTLETELPVSVALTLQRLGAISGVSLLPPGDGTLAQEVRRLRRAVKGVENRPGLIALLPAIARDPHQILSSHEVWTSRERARRVHPASLPQVLVKAHNIDHEGDPLRLPELRVEPVVDVYENRLIRAYHDQVLRRLRRVKPLLERAEASSLLEDVTEMLRSLSRARRQAAFLDEVGELTRAPDNLTMVLLKRPEYRKALEGYIEFHRSVASQLDEPVLDAPLEGLPKLYEIWGTLEVIKAILELAEENGFALRQHQLLRRDLGGVFIRVLPNGTPAAVLVRVADEKVIRVIPQRTYGRGGKDPLRSASYNQLPDVAVEIESDGSTEVYIFDPKYKLDSEEEAEFEQGRPKKVDIDKMHAYRDAIRNTHDERIVKFAGILYPGPTETFGAGLSALSAIPGRGDDLRTTVRQVLEPAVV